MKKSLIALAVASAFAAPAAFAATANVDVYGVLSVAIEDNDVSGSDIQVTDRVSKIGFKGSEDLGGGLKALWQIETQLSKTGSDGVDGDGTIGTRNTFIGLAGDFGVFVMGRHDTPYKLGTGSLDPFADTAADYNLGCVTGCVNAIHDMRTGNAIAYISPTWSGFHFAAAVVATNETAQGNSGDAIDAYSFTGVYANGPIFASASWQKAESAYSLLAANNDVTAILGYLGTGAPASTDIGGSDAWKLGFGYTFGDAKVGVIYENVDVDGMDTIETWGVTGVYNMGPIALKAAYYNQDWMGADADAWAIGADYNLSKRTTAYIVYTQSESDLDPVVVDKNTWAIGMKHSF